jgi:hypothetical protein
LAGVIVWTGPSVPFLSEISSKTRQSKENSLTGEKFANNPANNPANNLFHRCRLSKFRSHKPQLFALCPTPVAKKNLGMADENAYVSRMCKSVGSNKPTLNRFSGPPFSLLPSTIVIPRPRLRSTFRANSNRPLQK